MTMYKSLLSLVTVIALLPSCSSTPPGISVVCEENKIGNCIVKWETTPPIQGKVKVYASKDPNHIPEENPIAETDIARQTVTLVTNDPLHRYYYTLVFADKYRRKVAARNVIIPGIQNLRDVGGYPSYATRKRVRWGMLYRSAETDGLNKCSVRELKNIGIRTVIDLRTPQEIGKKNALLQKEFNVVNVPISTGTLDALMADIRRGKVDNQRVQQAVKQLNRNIVNEHTADFRQMFDLLLDKDNYPLVIQCSSGKGRTGVAIALILAALEVNDDTIMDDYQLSNNYFDIPRATQYAYQLPANSQVAITTLLSAREDFLNAAKDEIEKRYGSVENYLKKAVGLSGKDIRRLQNILLTKE